MTCVAGVLFRAEYGVEEVYDAGGAKRDCDWPGGGARERLVFWITGRALKGWFIRLLIDGAVRAEGPERAAEERCRDMLRLKPKPR
jgi:hypothetical protein